MFCEKFIRKAAGLGKASRLPDPDSYDIAYKFCDVLVVGAGPTGLLAAAELAEQGQKVILVEQDFEVGGSLLSGGRTEEITLRDTLLKRFEKAGGQVMLRATAFGLYDGLVTGVLERCSDHQSAPEPFSPREISHIIHPQHVVLATGACERGFAFGNNDRPKSEELTPAGINTTWLSWETPSLRANASNSASEGSRPTTSSRPTRQPSSR